MAMTGSLLWDARKAAMAGVTPYQGADPVAAATYRDQVGTAESQAIIDYFKANAVITVSSVSGVTPGSGTSGTGSGTISA